jgi:hypothetical protein
MFFLGSGFHNKAKNEKEKNTEHRRQILAKTNSLSEKRKSPKQYKRTQEKNTFFRKMKQTTRRTS